MARPKFLPVVKNMMDLVSGKATKPELIVGPTYFGVSQGRQACRLLVHAFKMDAEAMGKYPPDIILAAQEAARALSETLETYDSQRKREKRRGKKPA